MKFSRFYKESLLESLKENVFSFLRTTMDLYTIETTDHLLAQDD